VVLSGLYLQVSPIMAKPILSINALCKSYGSVVASDNISLTLQSHEIHALIGPNGAGKSTLVQQVFGSVQPDSGTVQFLDKDITRLSTAARAKRGLGRTFQVSALPMQNTVLENVVLGTLAKSGKVFRFLQPVMRNQALCEQAEQVLERVELLPHKHKITAKLSHGQRRLLELAMALSLQPKAFLMDEPMAGLGVEGSQRLTSFLNELRHQAPILLIEHDMDVVFALADRISVLVYGKIIATGTVDEIRANEAVRCAYLGEDAS